MHSKEFIHSELIGHHKISDLLFFRIPFDFYIFDLPKITNHPNYISMHNHLINLKVMLNKLKNFSAMKVSFNQI